MIRPVALLIAAMQLSRPSMPAAEAKLYADALNKVALETQIDPLAMVAIVHYETHWNPGQISPDGEDHGLGQVRARFLAACRDDADPVNEPSDACRAAKAQLLDGVTNIRRMGGIIAANKKLCREKIGNDTLERWVAGYEGLNYPEQNRWCVPGEKTVRVLEYYDELIERLLPRKVVASKGKHGPPRAQARAAPKPTPAHRPQADKAAPGAKR